jgi:hypothetical protein
LTSCRQCARHWRHCRIARAGYSVRSMRFARHATQRGSSGELANGIATAGARAAGRSRPPGQRRVSAPDFQALGVSGRDGHLAACSDVSRRHYGHMICVTLPQAGTTLCTGPIGAAGVRGLGECQSSAGLHSPAAIDVCVTGSRMAWAREPARGCTGGWVILPMTGLDP